jgi:hypothetical protein
MIYDKNTFQPYKFEKNKKYYPTEETEHFIIIKNIKFKKNKSNFNYQFYIYDYFYTQNEVRKLKLLKLKSND